MNSSKGDPTMKHLRYIPHAIILGAAVFVGVMLSRTWNEMMVETGTGSLSHSQCKTGGEPVRPIAAANPLGGGKYSPDQGKLTDSSETASSKNASSSGEANLRMAPSSIDTLPSSRQGASSGISMISSQRADSIATQGAYSANRSGNASAYGSIGTPGSQAMLQNIHPVGAPSSGTQPASQIPATPTTTAAQVTANATSLTPQGNSPQAQTTSAPSGGSAGGGGSPVPTTPSSSQSVTTAPNSTENSAYPLEYDLYKQQYGGQAFNQQMMNSQN